jgi:MFS transporter, CP family, cyanate transporter
MICASMTSDHTPVGRAPSRGYLLKCAALLWLAGIGLRLTVLAVPPVIPQIHADLNLTETEVGILTGLPQVLFAAAAVAGSLLIARLGALRTLVLGLFLSAVASALRGAVLDVVPLYAATVIMAFGVAIMQPALPPLTRQWLPDRVGFATAVYSNGLLIGEILPTALTIPLVLPFVGASWRLSFLVWAVPAALIALVVAMLAPRGAEQSESASAAGRRWWPDWRDRLIWRLGLMLASITSMYFGGNAFLPDYLKEIGRADLTSAALTALNLGQLPASLLLLAAADRLERRASTFLLAGVLCLASVIGIVFAPGAWIVASAGLLGFAAGGTFVLMLALPPLLSPPEDVHRVSAAMLTLGYAGAVIVPIVSGLVWDVTGKGALALVPFGACAVAVMALAPTIRFERRDSAGETG